MHMNKKAWSRNIWVKIKSITFCLNIELQIPEHFIYYSNLCMLTLIRQTSQGLEAKALHFMFIIYTFFALRSNFPYRFLTKKKKLFYVKKHIFWIPIRFLKFSNLGLKVILSDFTLLIFNLNIKSLFFATTKNHSFVTHIV